MGKFGRFAEKVTEIRGRGAGRCPYPATMR